MSRQRSLKVLMLASSYPRTQEDSASVFLRHLAEALGDRGLQVHVLAPAEGQNETRVEGPVIVHRFQYLPVSWQRLAYGSGILPNLQQNPWLWVQVPFFLTSMSYSLHRVIRTEEPDLIHAHWILPQGLIAVAAKYLYKLPVITTAHGTDTFALQARSANWVKRFVVAKSDAWTSNSHATSQAMGELPFPAARIIPMGVNVRRFSSGEAASLRRELPENELLVLFVGRLIENKGCHILLEAFSLLPADLRARTTLWVIGNGQQRVPLEQQAKALAIFNKIRFWGDMSNDRLPDFYASADLFVAPSIEGASGSREGQGVVLLEASAAKLAAIATKTGGMSEVIADGVTGLLVEAGDPKLLAAAIEKLLRDKRLRTRLAENARNNVTSRYDWSNIAAQFEELYRQVCEDSSVVRP
ncbi:MAG: glycosyltransferase [Deltaproteobacteria bacterium]|nr:glycosyltransferase [Deltaproteobacteria bacterium]